MNAMPSMSVRMSSCASSRARLTARGWRKSRVKDGDDSEQQKTDDVVLVAENGVLGVDAAIDLVAGRDGERRTTGTEELRTWSAA